MPTQQSQNIQTANQIIALAGAMLAVYQQMVVLDAAWVDNNAANQLAALPTAALKTDGSLGTADVTPVVANPIDTRVVPTLNRAVSSNQIASMKTIVDALVTLVNGSSVTAQAGARGILNAAVGG